MPFFSDMLSFLSQPNDPLPGDEEGNKLDIPLGDNDRRTFDNGDDDVRTFDDDNEEHYNRSPRRDPAFEPLDLAESGRKVPTAVAGFDDFLDNNNKSDSGVSDSDVVQGGDEGVDDDDNRVDNGVKHGAVEGADDGADGGAVGGAVNGADDGTVCSHGLLELSPHL